MKSKVKSRKIKIEREQILRLFPEKNNTKTDLRVLTTFSTLKEIVNL